MKLILTAAALSLMPAAAFAQTAPAPVAAAAVAPAPAAAPVSAAKFNLDTPIEQIVADPAAHAALTAVFAGNDVVANPSYDQFKSMSLNQVAPYAPEKLTPEVMKAAEAALAAVK